MLMDTSGDCVRAINPFTTTKAPYPVGAVPAKMLGNSWRRACHPQTLPPQRLLRSTTPSSPAVALEGSSHGAFLSQKARKESGMVIDNVKDIQYIYPKKSKNMLECSSSIGPKKRMPWVES